MSRLMSIALTEPQGLFQSIVSGRKWLDYISYVERDRAVAS